MFTGIPHDQVSTVWHEVEPWIDKACKRGGLYQAQDILEMLLQRELSLWIYRNGDELQALCVTEIVNYPLCRVCDVLIGTGFNRKNWQHCILIIEAWAKSNGCQKMRPIVRPGWAKIFKLFGYRHTHSIVEKEI